MITDTLLNKLPDFLGNSIDNRYIYKEIDFMPFVKLKDTANFFAFQDVIAGIGLSQENQCGLVYHQLTSPSRLHYHDYVEICYVAKGRLIHIVNQEPILMSEGDFSIIPKGAQHLLAPLEDNKPWVIDFFIHSELLKKINVLDKPLSILEQATHFIFDNPSENYPIVQALRTFLEDYIQAKYQANLFVIGSFIQFLFQLNIQDKKKQTNKLDSLTINCLQLIHENPAHITQKQLAAKLNYNPSYLSRHIKSTTGKTISQHITEEKLRISQDLLANTKLSINDIIEQIGYASESHFFRVFKEYYQITPNHYRKLMTE